MHRERLNAHGAQPEYFIEAVLFKAGQFFHNNGSCFLIEI
jgi:hypothetical protein